MTEITTEKARIGAPSAQPFIDGFTEEGESLSPINANASKAPLAGEAVKSHSHGGGVGIPDSSRAGKDLAVQAAQALERGEPPVFLKARERLEVRQRVRGQASGA